jgi:phage virion morphogenesis protein
VVAIVVQVSGFEPIVAVLDHLERPQWDDLLRTIGMTIEEQTVNHFTQQAGPDGAWEPTKRGGPALILTGRLRGSISHAVFPQEVHIGTNVHYGRYHQFGTRTIPQRAFLGLTAQDENEVQGVIEDFIGRMIEGR